MKKALIDGVLTDVDDNYGISVPSEEERIQEIINTVQNHLDLKAHEYKYDSILSACSYAAYTNPFQIEGQKFVAWRGDVWAYCYQALSEVQNGTRTEPTADELISELPILTIP